MTIVDELRRDESRVLDRLVDGELSQHERRELLAALDDEPGAWRRCALAFLESQSWRWQLAHLAAEPIVALAAVSAGEGAGPARRRKGGSLWNTWLAMAAGLFVAFALGTQFSPSGEPQVAAEKADPGIAQGKVTVANAVADALPVMEAASSDAQDPEAGPAAETESPWETLTLALVDGAEPLNKIEVRAKDLDADDAALADFMAPDESTLSAALADELEQAGFSITRERHLVPVSLSDGRRMIVPVEQVDIRHPEVAKF